jgi:hypothetical protein
VLTRTDEQRAKVVRFLAEWKDEFGGAGWAEANAERLRTVEKYDKVAVILPVRRHNEMASAVYLFCVTGTRAVWYASHSCGAPLPRTRMMQLLRAGRARFSPRWCLRRLLMPPLFVWATTSRARIRAQR